MNKKPSLGKIPDLSVCLSLWRLQLKKIIFELRNTSYVIIRLDENFPKIRPKQDVDILTRDIDQVIETIRQHTIPPFKIRQRVVVKDVQWHLDIYYSYRFIFKFDLYRDMAPVYRLVKLDPTCSELIINERVTTVRDGLNLSVPKLSTDLSLRYLEYIEKRRSRPDKIKHLRYTERFPDVNFYKVKVGETGVIFT